MKKIFGLAPMDGITDLPYRYICQKIVKKYNSQYLQNFWTWTEFMSAEGFVRNPNGVSKAIIHFENQTTPLIAQIYGGDEKALIQTTQIILKKYPEFKGIELNIGCPSPKIVINGAGAGMMKNKEKTLKIIQKMSDLAFSYNKLFTIKTRIGIDEQDKPSQIDFIIQASQFCNIITVHGRTFKQQHSGEVDRTNMQKIQKILSNQKYSKKLSDLNLKYFGIERPIFIINGGIQNFQEIQKIWKDFDGAMIGQAAIGNPRVFINHKPNLQEKLEIILDHLNLMLSYEIYINQFLPEFTKNKGGRNQKDIKIKLEDLLEIQQKVKSGTNTEDFYYTPIEFRKYLFNYVKGLTGSKEFKVQISQIKSYNQLLDKIKYFFDKLNKLSD